ncbi:nucleoside 2-deoxyribosyltransferase [Deltaproteobacteria bacterium TL4]
MSSSKDYVYCSGPLFCPEEIGGMTAISKVLEAQGFATFLPHRDGLENYVMKFVNSPLNLNLFHSRALIDRAIFALDVYQIVERCQFFVFNMNGRVPDEGGVVEAAIAYAAGKPLVLYKNDARSAFNGSDNSMILGLAYSPIVSDINKIPQELHKVSKQLGKLGDSPYQGENIPPTMRETIKFGRQVWKILTTLNPKPEKQAALSELEQAITDLCLNPPSS